MPRHARKFSISGYYHMILRGVNHQDIFYDEEDRIAFLQFIKKYADDLDITIIVYCLMTNHIHMLVYAPDGLEVFVKKIASGFVYYYNHKYARIGHLFQERYKSIPVDTEDRLLGVFRYILRNPEKAGICRTEDYRWSSFGELVEKDIICDLSDIYGLIGTRRELIQFVLMGSDDDEDYMEFDSPYRMTEEDAIVIIRKITGLTYPVDIQKLPKPERDQFLVQIKREGVSITQAARITGLGRNIVQRAK